MAEEGSHSNPWLSSPHETPLRPTASERSEPIGTLSLRSRESTHVAACGIPAVWAAKAILRATNSGRNKSKRLDGGERWIRTHSWFPLTFAQNTRHFLIAFSGTCREQRKSSQQTDWVEGSHTNPWLSSPYETPLRPTASERSEPIGDVSLRLRESSPVTACGIPALWAAKAILRAVNSGRNKSKRLDGGERWIRTHSWFPLTFAQNTRQF